MVDRVPRIRAAAQLAHQLETDAEFAGGDTSLDLWVQYDEAIAGLIGLIISPDGVATLDAIEARIGGASMSFVPQEWTSLMVGHRAAQIERDIMRDLAKTQQARDMSAAAYARQCDQMMDLMDILSVRLELGRITMLLGRRDC